MSEKASNEELKDNEGPKIESGEANDAQSEKDGVQLSQEDCEKLMAEIEELRGMKENMLRTAADFENAKKRLAKEKEDYVKFAAESLIKNLLSVLDSFERALSHASEAQDKDQIQGLVKGIEMVFKQLEGVLKSSGVEKINTEGAQFDPHLHEAIAFVEEEGKDEEIVDEIEAGYQLHGKIIRASKVRVRKSPS